MGDRSASVASGRNDLPRRFRTLVVIVSAAYPLALLTVILMLRFVGEQWWITIVALYLPRLGFAIPLPFTFAATWRWSRRIFLVPQLIAIYLILFPLMGLNLGTGRLLATERGNAIRLVSYNIDTGSRGIEGVIAQVRAFEPNLVLLQEAHEELRNQLAAAFLGWHVDQHGQFFVASRYPIRSVYLPPPLSFSTGEGGARFVSYLLETPLGPVNIYNVHTTSPRDSIDELRGNGLREEIRTGRLFSGTKSGLIEFNAYRRMRQIEASASAARASPYPVILAGDTNLPGLSRVLAEQLNGFQDAFDAVGRGFGYTFPDKHPWMRIDRILVNRPLRALDFRVGNTNGSDHLCVFAIIGNNG